MSNNKQSSVDWFANESWQLKVQLDNQEISVDEYAVAYVRLLYKAKAMHREEQGKTWDTAMDNLKARGENYVRAYVDFDEYYNETYGDVK
jgi:hypothetical protein